MSVRVLLPTGGEKLAGVLDGEAGYLAYPAVKRLFRRRRFLSQIKHAGAYSAPATYFLSYQRNDLLPIFATQHIFLSTFQLKIKRLRVIADIGKVMPDAFCIIPSDKSQKSSYSAKPCCNLFIVICFYIFNVRIIELFPPNPAPQNKRTLRKRYSQWRIPIRNNN